MGTCSWPDWARVLLNFSQLFVLCHWAYLMLRKQPPNS